MFPFPGVHVTDSGTPIAHHSNSTVVISIAPVNEFSPQFTHRNSASLSVEENIPVVGRLVLIKVNATDQDFGLQGKCCMSDAIFRN